MAQRKPSKPISSEADKSSGRISPQTDSRLTTVYLFLYNSISAFFWLAVFMRVALILPVLGPSYISGGVEVFSRWVQTAAILEVFHSIFGIVRSPIFTTLMQITSRLLLVWGVVYLFPTSGALTLAYSTMLISWSITEVIRYSYYAYNLNSAVPSWLIWLRYNTFFVLYPTGVASELLVIYASLDDAKSMSPLYSLVLKAVFLIYIPGFYMLFTHMMKQRRRILKNLGKKREN
ncbi:tyrosine phosphatase-like protein [Dipodascopsis uninucleata]